MEEGDRLSLPKPHGGTLIAAYDPAYDYSSIQKKIKIDAIGYSDLELIAVGLFSPVSYTHLTLPTMAVV